MSFWEGTYLKAKPFRAKQVISKEAFNSFAPYGRSQIVLSFGVYLNEYQIFSSAGLFLSVGRCILSLSVFIESSFTKLKSLNRKETNHASLFVGPAFGRAQWVFLVRAARSHAAHP
jgi:hypothetical protein